VGRAHTRAHTQTHTHTHAHTRTHAHAHKHAHTRLYAGLEPADDGLELRRVPLQRLRPGKGEGLIKRILVKYWSNTGQTPVTSVCVRCVFVCVCVCVWLNEHRSTAGLPLVKHRQLKSASRSAGAFPPGRGGWTIEHWSNTGQTLVKRQRSAFRGSASAGGGGCAAGLSRPVFCLSTV
jgi:hypothetical protein